MELLLLFAAFVVLVLISKVVVKIYEAEQDEAAVEKSRREQETEKRALSLLETAGDETLRHILLADSDAAMRRSAAHKVDDQKTLLRAALAEKDPAVLRTLVTKLSKDQSALAQICEKAVATEARSRAAVYVTDPLLLERLLFERGVATAVRHAAAGMVRDESVLYRMSRDKDPFVRKNACWMTSDQRVLEQLALHDTEEDIRVCAVARLTTREILVNPVRKDRSSEVRLQAAARLANLGLQDNPPGGYQRPC